MLVAAGSVFGGVGSIMINVQAPPQPWGDPQVHEKLETLISRDDAFRISGTGNAHYNLPAFPTARHDTDSLLNWAQEAGTRYLVVVTIDSERLTRKKSW